MGNYLTHQMIYLPPPRVSMPTVMILSERCKKDLAIKSIQFHKIETSGGMYGSLSGIPITMVEITPTRWIPNTHVVWSYGNACDIYHTLITMCKIAITLNAKLYIYDYPGYGMSIAPPASKSVDDTCCADAKCNASEKSCIAALQCVIERITVESANNVKLNQITLVGQSLGTGVTVGYASKVYKNGGGDYPKSVILVSPFKSLASVVVTNWLVESAHGFLGGDTYNNCNNIKNIECPIKIYHGKRDSLISFNHSLELQKKNSRVRLILLPDADHNDILNKINMVTLLD
jgi:hypothetical protein